MPLNRLRTDQTASRKEEKGVTPMKKALVIIGAFALALPAMAYPYHHCHHGGWHHGGWHHGWGYCPPPPPVVYYGHHYLPPPPPPPVYYYGWRRW